ncbi:probable GTP diphosphokinase RSH1, chloroplastic [Coccomyxa sp. Obi]|nr:probable GTP diphosphokinase RSH1, chloroplastic [Coccomyxa sp. Obi]
MFASQFSLSERRCSNSLAGSRSTPENLYADESLRWRSSGRRGVLLQSSRAQLRVNPTDFISFAGACAPNLQGRYYSRQACCRAVGTLQPTDYSFYQTLPAEKVTDKFLWGRLEPLLGYLGDEQKKKVLEALHLAYDSHSGQLRKSGEAFITHPVEVTRILAELKMDHESLIAGLLHDTVEDTENVKFEEIEFYFGKAVRQIVEGETRFSKIGAIGENASRAELAALDLKQLFLAMTEEVRIIIVKLADRLHNMRTLDSMPPHKQKKIADETLLVFAPLARLLGLYSIKEELEALSFRYSNPEEYALVQRRLDALAKDQEDVVLKAQSALQDKLETDTFLQERVKSFTVGAHQKNVYSVYRKLKERGVELEDLQDVAQLRVIVTMKDAQESSLYGTGSQLCYHIMGLVHTMWAPIPGAVKDYIATPKPNGYQSLHTTVLPLGAEKLFPLEVQIRTAEMHRLAEYGIAGENWTAAKKASDPSTLRLPSLSDSVNPVNALNGVFKRLMTLGDLNLYNYAAGMPALYGTANSYRNGQGNGQVNGTSLPKLEKATGSQRKANGVSKDSVQAGRYGGLKLDQRVMERRINWLNSIREWQSEFVNSLSAREFVDCITDDLLGRGVFVFTPSGEVMRLPKGATVVDFAYHVHTDVGNQMFGAKVNGKVVHAGHALANAEVVEVLTYDGRPSRGSIERHQEWIAYAQTKTARHKLAKFLKDHADLLDSGTPPDMTSREASSGLQQASEASTSSWAAAKEEAESQVLNLTIECTDRPGLLAEIAQIIADFGHNIKTYSGKGSYAGCFTMKYQLEGDPDRAADLCNAVGCMPSVLSWSLGCALHEPDNSAEE